MQKHYCLLYCTSLVQKHYSISSTIHTTLILFILQLSSPKNPKLGSQTSKLPHSPSPVRQKARHPVRVEILPVPGASARLAALLNIQLTGEFYGRHKYARVRFEGIGRAIEEITMK